jgi:ribosomal protein S18 acetylase RimI-like enzyme
MVMSLLFAAIRCSLLPNFTFKNKASLLQKLNRGAANVNHRQRPRNSVAPRRPGWLGARVNSATSGTTAALLNHIDRYLDGLPRRDGRAEDFGPLTLFVRGSAGPALHAQPTRGWSERGGRRVTTADVEAVLARQRALGVAPSFEWVDSSAPALRTAAEDAGLKVTERPLLVLPAAAPTPTAFVGNVSDGVSVLTLTADDPHLPSAVAAPHLAFAEIGTHVGEAGTAELAERVGTLTVEITRTADRVRAGRTTLVAAVRNGAALSSGLFPGIVEGVTEVCAVGTLPAARRQGLALAVTAALVVRARGSGAHTVFLGATDETVARIYARLGFRHIGTYLEAEPPE